MGPPLTRTTLKLRSPQKQRCSSLYTGPIRDSNRKNTLLPITQLLLIHAVNYSFERRRLLKQREILAGRPESSWRRFPGGAAESAMEGPRL